MDNNAPNKPATTAHKVRMKHTYFAISFGGGSVIAVLPICLENILEKICKKKVDSSQKERLKRRRKDSRGGAEFVRKVKIRLYARKAFTIPRKEPLLMYSPHNFIKYESLGVYNDPRCLFTLRMCTLLYPSSSSGKVAGVVWYKIINSVNKMVLDKDAKCAHIDALATNARSI